MNFYKRYVGDIQRDTGHLSLSEFGAYDRLLDHYYATEQPLPADFDACCRIARAMTKDERKAVLSILKQFFKLTDAGYVQGRAEKEIADAQPAMVSARLNGQKGGRPKKPKNETPNKPNGFPENNPNETQHESSPEPEPLHELSNSESNCNLAEPKNETTKTHTQIQIGLIADGLKEIGMMPFNPQLPKFLKLLEVGATVDEFISTALEKKGTDKFNFSYLITTMTNRREDAALAKPMHQGVMPNATPKNQSIQDKRSATAKAMFGEENGNNDARIIDISDYSTSANRPLISSPG
ncbi:MAG TPA: YdaU family protein [Methylotenera sp.]|nr:YdaU family protein [Methylotenera sp.]